MWISNIHRLRALLYLNNGVHFPFSHQRFCTNTSDSHSFAVSYLIHNFGFSPQSASKLCSTYKVRFKTAENPNSVLTFFTNQGFSNSQLHNIIAKVPSLLCCDLSKRVLPKFEFFLSKSISNSDFVRLVTKHPYVLSSSLNDHILPSYQFLSRFFQSDKETIAVLIIYPTSVRDKRRMSQNITMLIENGMKNSCIASLLRIRCNVFNIYEHDMVKVVEELKDLGFDPSKSAFSVALRAKLSVTRTQWNEKVDAFNKWGWSDEDILEAFKRYPHYMLTSVNKINLVMSFWVNHLGWDALALARFPYVLSLSLERRVIPRATVVQFLLKKGLRKSNASLLTPFQLPEKSFVDQFIKRFVMHSSNLLKLYEEKLILAYTNTRENNGIS